MTLLLMVILCPLQSSGQGAPYVEVTPSADLDFGMVPQNAGVVEENATFPNIGKFKVTARLPVLPGTFPQVDLTFFPPITIDGGSATGIPYVMAASTNSVADNPLTSTNVSGTNARITLEISEGTDQGLPVYSAYVYIFGSVTVGLQQSGGYASPLTLRAEAVFFGIPECDAPAWTRETRYEEGDVVTHLDAAWRANRFTTGNEPGRAHDFPDEDDPDDKKGSGRPWDFVDFCD